MYGRYERFICSATSCVSPKTEGGAGQPPLSHAGHDHQPAGQWGFLDEANLAWFFIPGRVVGTEFLYLSFSCSGWVCQTLVIVEGRVNDASIHRVPGVE